MTSSSKRSSPAGRARRTYPRPPRALAYGSGEHLSIPTDSTLLQAFIIVAGSTLLSVAGLLAVARWVPDELRGTDHDAKSAFLSMAGVSYAILPAFVVVAVWSDFTEAGETSQEEVTRLSNLMRGAAPFPAVARVPMRRSVPAYAYAVVRLGWPSMADGEASPVAARRYENIPCTPGVCVAESRRRDGARSLG